MTATPKQVEKLQASGESEYGMMRGRDFHRAQNLPILVTHGEPRPTIMLFGHASDLPITVA